jgi:GNAT superfamily N-acetyltransferase
VSVAEIRELAAGETGRAWDAIGDLRPHLGDEAEFVRVVDEVQRPQGYRLVAAFADPGDGRAGAAAGFRVFDWLATGRVLYVDDLATAPAARRRGLAGALLEWLAEEGVRLGCNDVQLDSQTHPKRWDAHRLYLNHGFAITSFHFYRALGGGAGPPR